MRGLRLIVLASFSAMVLGGLRAAAQHGDPVDVGGRWAMIGGATAVGLHAAHAVLGRGVEGPRRMAGTFLTGIFVLVLGLLARKFSAGGQDPEIAAVVLAVCAVALAPMLWAWMDWVAVYLQRLLGPLDALVTHVHGRGRVAALFTAFAAVTVLAVVGHGLTR